MSDEIIDPDKKAKELKEQFSNAMSGESETVTSEVIYMADYLQRKIDGHIEKSNEFYSRAQALHVRQGQPIEQDPYAAPLLSLSEQEARKIEPIQKHLMFIRNKEAELNEPAVNIQIPVSNTVRQPTGWGTPLNLQPFTTNSDKNKT